MRFVTNHQDPRVRGTFATTKESSLEKPPSSTATMNQNSDDSTTAISTPPNRDSSISTPTTQDSDEPSEVLLPPSPMRPNAETVTEDVDPDAQFNEESIFDPNAIVEDILTYEESGDKYFRAQTRYKRDREEQLGKEVCVGTGAKRLKWTVISDVKKSEVEVLKEKFMKTGVRGFDFNLHRVPDGRNFRPNFFLLLVHLWPGDWKSQLVGMNEDLEEDKARQRKERDEGRSFSRRVLYMRTISDKEYWLVFVVILCARVAGSNKDLWTDPERNGGDGFLKKGLDLARRLGMTKTRFEEIKSRFSYVFADRSQKTVDEWWPIMGGVRGFNENRKKTIMAPNTKVLDETMSAFVPKTTPKGNLPHLSNIPRKPEPLGTEFKTVAASGMGK